MKKLICIALAVIMLTAAATFYSSAGTNVPPVAEDLYKSYSYSYLSVYDLNKDGRIDHYDFTEAKQLRKAAEEAGEEYTGVAPGEIASFLVHAPGLALDLDRDGHLNYKDALYIDYYGEEIEAAGLDYLGPTVDDFRLVLSNDEEFATLRDRYIRYTALFDFPIPEDGSENEANERIDAAIKAIDEIGEVKLTQECIQRLYRAERAMVKLTLEEVLSLPNYSVYLNARMMLEETFPVGDVAGCDLQTGVSTFEPLGSGMTAVKAPIALGDVDGSGKINARDVFTIMKAIVDNDIIVNKAAADIDCDGNINGRDVILLMKKMLFGSTIVSDSPSYYCCLLGHEFTASYATETVHNAFHASPHCGQNTYLVVSCGRDGCDCIEKILVSSKRITTCHG